MTTTENTMLRLHARCYLNENDGELVIRRAALIDGKTTAAGYYFTVGISSSLIAEGGARLANGIDAEALGLAYDIRSERRPARPIKLDESGRVVSEDKPKDPTGVEDFCRTIPVVQLRAQIRQWIENELAKEMSR